MFSHVIKECQDRKDDRKSLSVHECRTWAKRKDCSNCNRRCVVRKTVPAHVCTEVLEA